MLLLQCCLNAASMLLRCCFLEAMPLCCCLNAASLLLLAPCACGLHRASCVLHLVSCLRLAPRVLCLASCVLRLASCVLRLASCTLCLVSCSRLVPCVLCLASCVLHLVSCVLLASCTLCLVACIVRLAPCTIVRLGGTKSLANPGDDSPTLKGVPAALSLRYIYPRPAKWAEITNPLNHRAGGCPPPPPPPPGGAGLTPCTPSCDSTASLFFFPRGTAKFLNRSRRARFQNPDRKFHAALVHYPSYPATTLRQQRSTKTNGHAWTPRPSAGPP